MRPSMRAYWQSHCDHFCAAPMCISWFDDGHRFRVAYSPRDGVARLERAEGMQRTWATVVRHRWGALSREAARSAARMVLLLAVHWHENGWRPKKERSTRNGR